MSKSHLSKIPVRVSKIVREFIIATNGSDTIRPSKSDLIWSIVKHNLVVADPNNQIKVKEEEDVVYIEILDCSGTYSSVLQSNQGTFLEPQKQRDAKSQHQVMINPFYRNSLSPSGERKIARHLKIQFKELFHTFMLSASLANPNLPQIEILNMFMETYNIQLSKVIKEETLLKSWRRDWRFAWLRSKQYQRLKGGPVFCPLIY